MSYFIRRSQVDPQYIEVLQEERLVQEIRVLFPLKGPFPLFSLLEEVEEWLAKEELRLAKKEVYRLISLRSYPRPILLKKLERRGFSSGVSLSAISEVERLGYLDPDFVEKAIEREWRRGYGPRYIENKLKMQGLDGGQVRPFFTDERQREGLLLYLAKRPKGKGPKQIQALLRRGFDLSLILQLIG